MVLVCGLQIAERCLTSDLVRLECCSTWMLHTTMRSGCSVPRAEFCSPESVVRHSMDTMISKLSPPTGGLDCLGLKLLKISFFCESMVPPLPLIYRSGEARLDKEVSNEGYIISRVLHIYRTRSAAACGSRMRWELPFVLLCSLYSASCTS